MLAVVQRVSSANVEVADPHYFADIGEGLSVLLGIESGDGADQAHWMARKLANLRIFNDTDSKMNRSIVDVSGEILLISQFTLLGDCSKGNRPSFIAAAEGDKAEPLVDLVGETLFTEHGIRVCKGVFGAKMRVSIVNEGPVTLVIQRD